MPQRIQRKRVFGWRMPPGAVNVTRGADWGNPFRIGDTITYRYGNENAGGLITLTIDRDLAVELFTAWVVQRGWAEQIRRELRGKDLVCWCPTWARCHADVLLEIANTALITVDGA